MRRPTRKRKIKKTHPKTTKRRAGSSNPSTHHRFPLRSFRWWYVAFALLLVFAGTSRANVKPAEERARMEVPIAVHPILDDVPLLKLGGKKMRAKLPDMWKKNPPHFATGGARRASALA